MSKTSENSVLVEDILSEMERNIAINFFPDEPEKKVKLKSYVYFWIRAYIQKDFQRRRGNKGVNVSIDVHTNAEQVQAAK